MSALPTGAADGGNVDPAPMADRDARLTVIRRAVKSGQGIYPDDARFVLDELDRVEHAIREHVPACYLAMVDPGAREALRRVVEEAADYREGTTDGA